jgi:hypothetical protein
MKFKKYIIIIFTVSLFIRLVYTFVPQFDYFSAKSPLRYMTNNQLSDGGSYVLIAQGFLKYGYPARGTEDNRLFIAGGFLYPILLSVNLIISNNLLPIILLQILLDSLIPVLLLLLAYKYTRKIHAAFIASLGYALYYPNFLYTRNIGTDSLYIFFLFLGIFWFLYKFDELKKRDYVIIGALFSITSLIRAPVYYPFLITSVLVFVYLLIFKRKYHKGIVIAFITFWIFQLPMLIISYRASGNFIAGSTGGNVVLMIGTYLPANGDNDEIYLKIFPNHPQNIIDSASVKNNWTQIQKDSAYSAFAQKQIIDNFTNHPFESLKMMGYQFSRFWFNFPFYNPPSIGTKIIAFINSVILLFASIGIFHLFKMKNFPVYIIFIVLLFYQSLHLLVFNSLRYSAPLIPIMLFLFSIGIYDIFAKIFKKTNWIIHSKK